MAFREYDSNAVVVSVGGADIEGFASGAIVTIEQLTDDYLEVVGTTGEVVRSRSNDRRATVTIRLMQTSPSNDILSAISNADLNAPNGVGVTSLYIRDMNGRALYSAASCWIARPPQVTFDQTAQPREWLVRCAELVRLDGGN